MSISGNTKGIRPGVCLSSNKPSNPFDGQVIYMTDVDQTAVWDGSQWTVLAPIAGGRNRIINGDFKIWQRGTGAFTTNGNYTSDRWVIIAASGQTVSVTQQSFTPGNAISGFEPTFYARLAWSGTPSGSFWFTQRVEDVRTFAGQQVVLSFWAKASSSTSVFAPTIEQNFGTGGSSVVTTTTSTITLTTSWQRFSIPISVPSISGKTIGTNSYLDVRPLNGGSTVNGINIDIWGVQLEAGAVATPFEFEDHGITLAKCQRYYWQNNSHYMSLTSAVGNSYSSRILYPTVMRATPTITHYSGQNLSGTAGNATFYQSTGGGASEAINLEDVSADGFQTFRLTNVRTLYTGSYTASAEL